jgi:hypothetical protein
VALVIFVAIGVLPSLITTVYGGRPPDGETTSLAHAPAQIFVLLGSMVHTGFGSTTIVALQLLRQSFASRIVAV